MIKVLAHKEDIRKTVYEFIRELFPEYLDDRNITIEINSLTRSVNVYSDDFNETFKYSNKSDERFEIKRAIINNLEKHFNKEVKWGILSGVRPTKLALKLLNEYTEEESKSILKNYYMLKESSINLLMDISNLEREIINKYKDGYSVYIHIPFCPSRCNYCSFNTYVNKEELIKPYLKILLKEIKRESEFFTTSPTSIYIGGGTPTAIGINNLENVIKEILNSFGIPLEFTVEGGRVETLSRDMLKMIKELGVNRISINPQSFNYNTLFQIGRNHNSEDFLKAFNMARNIGFDFINMDLILGLFGENEEDMINSIKKTISLEPENITVHTLALKKGSKIVNDKFKHINLVPILEKSKQLMKDSNYLPYYMYRQKRMIDSLENIGYSKKNKECLYNILMMEESQNIIGIGMASSTKIINKDNTLSHILNFKNIRDYINRSDEVILKRQRLYR